MVNTQSNRVDFVCDDNCHDLLIKVYKVKKVNNPVTFSVQFFVENDCTDNLQEVPAMTGFQTVTMALEEAKKFINERQWKLKYTKYIYQIFVRQLYNNSWAYKVVDTLDDIELVIEYNPISEEAALCLAVEYLKKHLE